MRKSELLKTLEVQELVLAVYLSFMHSDFLPFFLST